VHSDGAEAAERQHQLVTDLTRNFSTYSSVYNFLHHFTQFDNLPNILLLAHRRIEEEGIREVHAQVLNCDKG
jgi:hypothetical protein